jgi:hypothetical protein
MVHRRWWTDARRTFAANIYLMEESISLRPAPMCSRPTAPPATGEISHYFLLISLRAARDTTGGSGQQGILRASECDQWFGSAPCWCSGIVAADKPTTNRSSDSANHSPDRGVRLIHRHDAKPELGRRQTKHSRGSEPGGTRLQYESCLVDHVFDLPITTGRNNQHCSKCDVQHLESGDRFAEHRQRLHKRQLPNQQR